MADPRFAEFIDAVSGRLDAGAATYGDRSFSADPSVLVQELEQEALDLAGWGFVLWCRLRRLRDAAERLDPPHLPLVGPERHDALAALAAVHADPVREHAARIFGGRRT